MDDKDTLTQYILGGLSEAERERIEEEYFVNSETWEKLRAIEDSLIDSYVRGKLPLSQREQFDKYFLTLPGKRQRVEFARALMNPAARKSVAEEPVVWQQSHRVFRLGSSPSAWLVVTAACLALAVTTAFLIILNQQLRRDLNQALSDQTELRNTVQTLQHQLDGAKLTGGPSGQESAEMFSADVPTVSMLLQPGLLRNGQGKPATHILPILPAPSAVVLLLSLEANEYPEYEVILRTAEGKQVRNFERLTSEALRPGERVVAVRLPVQLFSPGDYIATLSGKTAKSKPQTLDSYSFTILQ